MLFLSTLLSIFFTSPCLSISLSSLFSTFFPALLFYYSSIYLLFLSIILFPRCFFFRYLSSHFLEFWGRGVGMKRSCQCPGPNLAGEHRRSEPVLAKVRRGDERLSMKLAGWVGWAECAYPAIIFASIAGISDNSNRLSKKHPEYQSSFQFFSGTELEWLHCWRMIPKQSLQLIPNSSTWYISWHLTSTPTPPSGYSNAPLSRSEQ
jgi:hypothetical protein